MTGNVPPLNRGSMQNDISDLKFVLKYDLIDKEWHLQGTYGSENDPGAIIVTIHNIHEFEGMMCGRCYEYLLGFFGSLMKKRKLI